MTQWNRDRAVDALVAIGVRWDDAREFTEAIGEALRDAPVPATTEGRSADG